MTMRVKFLTLSLAAQCVTVTAGAQTTQPPATLLENVRVFNGAADRLSVPTNVLVVGNKITAISSAAITPPGALDVTRIAGGGRTLMPGLTDAHTHLYTAGVTEAQLFGPNPDLAKLEKIELEQAEAMLLHGFTTIRDMAGPVFSAKAAIDEGKSAGPRIYPDGTLICQTSGHCDYSPPEHCPEASAARRSIDAGVTVIEHGQLLDERTVKYMADKGIWLSTRVLDEAGPEFPPLAREKKHQIIPGQDRV